MPICYKGSWRLGWGGVIAILGCCLLRSPGGSLHKRYPRLLKGLPPAEANMPPVAIPHVVFIAHHVIIKTRTASRDGKQSC